MVIIVPLSLLNQIKKLPCACVVGRVCPHPHLCQITGQRGIKEEEGMEFANYLILTDYPGFSRWARCYHKCPSMWIPETED